MEETRLLLPQKGALSVPNEVHNALHSSLRPSLVFVGRDEEVLFCEPARGIKGFTFPLIALAIATHATTALMGLFWFKKLGYIIANCIWLIGLVLEIILNYKWEFFGYRVVTNYRAAMVIPSKKWFPVSGVRSSYYSQTLTLLAKGKLVTKIRSIIPLKRTFFAELEYAKRRDGSGWATINGESVLVPFGPVRDIQRLEEILGSAVKSFLDENKSLRNQFKIRTEDPPEETHWERNTNLLLTTVSTIAFAAIVIMGTYIALERDFLTGVICMVDLVISVLLYGFSCFKFVASQYGNKNFIGKCYYFSK
eukprot:Phypoly_transcript_14998.p1 GENE.Phypoly_transcript_14998~~Phypoly_transcript_14998.p1  ORF type:complete len:308 (-),score=16.94 Phypoly_transcript_14998:1-924(-)